MLVDRVLARYELGVVEAAVLCEAAHCADALATLRAERRADATRQKLEIVWSRHLSGLLAPLRLEGA